MGSNSKGSVRNSSKIFGGGGGDFIPLSGTEVDKSITGDLEIKNPIDFGTRKIITYYDEEKTKYSAVIFDDGGNVMLESKQDFYTKLLLNSGTVEFHTDNPDSSGINAFIDFRTLANWTDTGLTQKMYVDDKFVQKGVDNSTTVVLNSATLDSTYPDATTGFRVYCASIIVGAMTYEKTPTGWLGFTCIVP